MKTPEMLFEESFAQLREPKRKSCVLYKPGAEDRIIDRLTELGLEAHDYTINVQEYRRYLSAGRYREDFPMYYHFNLSEKSLEHYIAADLLELNTGDIYIDIASEHSPVPDIYHRLFGVKAYRQDLAFPPGLNQDRIGGDAAHMPISDEFASKMALHCSFEHFEGGSDIGFIKELERVLKPGGAVCFVPFYLFEEYAIQTDPIVALREGLVFEDDAVIYAAAGWGNRHGRFYDPGHFVNRIVKNLGKLTLTFYRIMNAQAVDGSCYARFAIVVRKPRI
jgi:SAM-dependent methyltransferase